MTVRKVLHAADIHLDSPLQKLDAYEDAPVDRIRMASRRALENLTELAISESVDLVVIAGDLYDGDWTDENTGLFFVNQASKLVKSGIPVVVIRGNHDAANKMTLSLPLPKNPDDSSIMLDEQKVDRRVFDDLDIVVHGRSYRQRVEAGDMSAEYPKPQRGLFNLGVLHTSLSGFEGHDTYAPCTPTQLADKGYDYWALGHIHIRGEHQVPGAAPIVFSGNVQGRHIRESGEKGCVIVRIDEKNQSDVSFHPLDVLRWETFPLDVSTLQHEDEIYDAFETWLDAARSMIDDRLLVARVMLSGQSSRSPQWVRRSASIESSLRAVAVAHGDGQVWLEGLRVKCGLPSAEVQSGDPGIAAMEGPLESVASTITARQQDPDMEEWVRKELNDWIKKLPGEIDVDDPEFGLHDVDALKDWIEAAGADVVARLKGASA